MPWTELETIDYVKKFCLKPGQKVCDECGEPFYPTQENPDICGRCYVKKSLVHVNVNLDGPITPWWVE
jgi:hypothetical protein